MKTKTFISLFIVYTILAIEGWSNRDTLFHWAFLDPTSRRLLFTTWLCLLIALPVLFLLIAMSLSLRLERKNFYVTLLHICNVLLIVSFCSEMAWAGLRLVYPDLLPAYTTVQIKISYEPPIIPVEISVNSNGEITIEGNMALVTPFGAISAGIGTSTALYPRPDGKSLFLVISHRKNGSIVRDGYKVSLGQDEVYVETDGPATIHLKNSELDIDATQGEIRDIVIQGSPI